MLERRDGFEARIPWASLGLSSPTAVYFHVSAINGSGSNVPAGIDDNLGGPSGYIGAFAFRMVSITPDPTSSTPPGSPTVVEQVLTITNTGTLPDRYDLTAFSSMGFRVDFYDGATLMATDLAGDADFTDPGDYVNPAYDSNSDGRPNTPSLIPGGTFSLTVRITAPTGVTNVVDLTRVSAFSQASPNVCASALITTAIGEVTLTPTPQAKSVVAGQTVDYGLTLGNYSSADTFDLRALSSEGWRVDIYSGATLVATDLLGDGTWDSITSGHDTNSNGRPDFGVTPNGTTVPFTVRLTALAGATVGTVDTTSVLAQGATYGAGATATLTTTVRLRLTFTPSYTVAASTNKYSGQGTSVFYAHTLINSWPSADTVTLSATSAPTGWTIRYYTDPDGDGNPSDGTPITSSFGLAGNGGTLHLVVEVVIPTGLTLPLTHTAVVTATGTGSAPTVTDEVRVSYIASYADYNRTISKRVFALCETIYVKGSSLTALSTYTFRYINPSSTVIRTQTVTSNGNGEAIDQYTLTSSDERGNWTLELRNSSNTLVDSILVYIDPPITGNPSSVDPIVTGQASYALSGENLAITATYNNTSTGADYIGTTYQYLVRTSDLSQYLRSDGVFASYTGSELTRTTSPHTVYFSSSATETVTVNGVEFPSAGVYRIDITWLGSCSNTIATGTYFFPVGTTLTSYADEAHTVLQGCFLPGSTIYLGGSYYLSSTNYAVAYYRPDGTLDLAQSVTSTAGGALSASATASSVSGTHGTWHIVVYPAAVVPPPVWLPGDLQAMALLSIVVAPLPPTAGNDGPVCAGSTLTLTASSYTGVAVTYSWTGPNGFASALQNPSIASVTTAASGTYYVTATVSGCTSAAGTTEVMVNPSPADYNVTGGGSYCTGGAGVAVGLDGSQSGVNYQLYLDASPVGSPVAGHGRGDQLRQPDGGGHLHGGCHQRDDELHRHDDRERDGSGEPDPGGERCDSAGLFGHAGSAVGLSRRGQLRGRVQNVHRPHASRSTTWTSTRSLPPCRWAARTTGSTSTRPACLRRGPLTGRPKAWSPARPAGRG